jgi:hypothetical protein
VFINTITIMALNKVVLFCGLMLLVSCKKCKEKDSNELCTTKLEPAGNSLRLDGYYYHIYNPPYREIMFLYENGVLLSGGGVSGDQLADLESRFLNGQYYSNNKEDLMVWGNFRISNNKFTFERWYPSTNILIAYVREGEILNDSTIHISRSFRCDGSDSDGEDATWHFKKFGPKPDSTNQFVP